MRRKSVPIDVLKFLYAKSGNKCAFPGCNAPIFEENGLLTGECCHIEAYSKGGPRYSDITTIEEKNSDSNLILLCSRHHTIIDNDCSKYTTDVLKSMKLEHEQKFSGTQRELDEKMLFALEKSMDEYWDRIQIIDRIESDFKIKVDKDANIEFLLTNIEENFSNLESLFIQMSKSDKKLPSDLVELCKRVGVDYELFDKIPYYENSLINRMWEYHSLAVPNFSNHLKMYFLQFCVRVFEELAKSNNSYIEILKRYQEKLENHQKNNFYVD